MIVACVIVSALALVGVIAIILAIVRATKRRQEERLEAENSRRRQDLEKARIEARFVAAVVLHEQGLMSIEELRRHSRQAETARRVQGWGQAS